MLVYLQFKWSGPTLTKRMKVLSWQRGQYTSFYFTASRWTYGLVLMDAWLPIIIIAMYGFRREKKRQDHIQNKRYKEREMLESHVPPTINRFAGNNTIQSYFYRYAKFKIRSEFWASRDMTSAQQMWDLHYKNLFYTFTHVLSNQDHITVIRCKLCRNHWLINIYFSVLIEYNIAIFAVATLVVQKIVFKLDITMDFPYQGIKGKSRTWKCGALKGS